MKKTVSINIGGVVFHIEEDAYENLRKYLAEINQYFSKYDDSKEIVSDIESRIAEVFMKKLKGKKQSLNQTDVDEILKTMGSVKDFAMSESEDPEESSYQETTFSQADSGEGFGTKKLFRDVRRKVLGGVCSGIAHYLNIDALWIRLLFAALFFGFWFIPPASGIALIVYLILWAVVPASAALEEDKSIKRLYRNPEERVIGGVASGIAAYFGTDAIVIRLLFVLSVLIFGFGILLYIILWIITPEAVTTTDKMKMRGEPVTLTNIETAVKKSFNVDPNQGESTLVKILLFPFRLLGQILDAIGKALGPLLIFLVEAIRILAGVILALWGLGSIAALTVALLFFLGAPMGQSVIMSGVPPGMIENTVTSTVALAGFLVLVVPAFALTLLGVRFLAKKPIYNAAFLWSLVGVWMIGLIMAAVTIPPIAFGFQDETEYEQTESISVPGPIVYLAVNEVGYDDYEGVDLTIRPTESDDMKLEYIYSASGESRADALENAKDIEYNWDWKNDSTMVFDSNILFKKDQPFRNQEVDLTLYMPIGQKFVLPYEIRSIIRHTVYYYGYEIEDLKNHTFYFSDMETLECDGCTSGGSGYVGDDHKEIHFNEDFTSIDIAGYFDVIYQQGDESLVRLEGKDRYISDVEVKMEGSELNISIEDNSRTSLNFKRKIKVFIQSPDLDEIDISGLNDLEIRSLNTESLKISMAGKNESEVRIEANELEIVLEGSSDMELDGRGENLKIDISGICELDAGQYYAENVEVNTSGTSKAYVYASGVLTVDERGISKVVYSGNPTQINDLGN